MQPELQVRHVAGRYGKGTLKTRNIVASVVREVARVYLIRLDDVSDESAWLEITVEVETQEVTPCVSADGTT